MNINHLARWYHLRFKRREAISMWIAGVLIALYLGIIIGSFK